MEFHFSCFRRFTNERHDVTFISATFVYNGDLLVQMRAGTLQYRLSWNDQWCLYFAPRIERSGRRLNIWQARSLPLLSLHHSVSFDNIIFTSIRVMRTNIEIIIKSECETISNMPITIQPKCLIYTLITYAIELRQNYIGRFGPTI